MRRNIDEIYVLNVANTIPGVNARLATRQEDCGSQKADIVVCYGGREFYIQVSRQPKSNRSQKNLERRGTHPVYTHRFSGIPVGEEGVRRQIESIIYEAQNHL